MNKSFKHAVSIILTLCMVLCAVMVASPLTASALKRPDPVAVSGNYSSASGTDVRWVALDDVMFGNADGSDNAVISINPGKTYQDYYGLGVSIDETSVSNIWKLPEAEREKAIQFMADPVNGAGMDVYRVCIGSSDLIEHGPAWSHDELPDGVTEDFELEYFSIAKDIKWHIVEMCQAILRYNPDAKFFGSAWSAPAWMKTTNTFRGYVEPIEGNPGSFYQAAKLRDNCLNVFAKYYVKWIQAYQEMGVPIEGITMLNEPGMDVVYPAMDINIEQQKILAKEIKKEFANAGLSDKFLWVHDFNIWDWQDPNSTETKNYYRIFDDPETKAAADGIAFHTYWGDYASAGKYSVEFEKPIHMTEGGSFSPTDALNMFMNGFSTYTAWAPVTNQEGGWHYWTGDRINFSEEEFYKPRAGWRNRFIVVNESDPQNVFWTPTNNGINMGQITKYVVSGAKRIDASVPNGIGNVVAYQNPDGEIVVIVRNSGRNAVERNLTLDVEGYDLDASVRVPANSFATYRFRLPGYTRTFDLVAEIMDYGQSVTSLIIDTETVVNKSDVALDSFAVSAKNLQADGMPAYEGPRKITGFYLSDENKPSTDKSLESGRYIVLELEWDFNLAASAAHYYPSRNVRLKLDYKVEQLQPVGNLAIAPYAQQDIQQPIYDDFDKVMFEGMAVHQYAPDAQDGALPLVVWNHGVGENYYEINGVNNEGSQLFANQGGIGWVMNSPEPCYVIAIQRSQPGDVYSREKVVKYIQEELIDKGLVDADRVYVGGASQGGTETWNFLLDANLRDFFAAYFTCPGGGIANTTDEQLAEIVDIPLWLIQTGNDGYDATKLSYDRLMALGANVKWTSFEPGYNGTFTGHPGSEQEGGYSDHWSWVPTLRDFDSEEYGTSFMDWLFAQTNRVRVGLVAPDYVDTDRGTELSYTIAAEKVRPTNLLKVSAKFDNSKLAYAGAEIAAPSELGLSFVGAPTYDPTTGAFNALVAKLQSGAAFSSVDPLDLVKIKFVVKPGVADGEKVLGEMTVGKATIVSKDGLGASVEVDAILDPAKASTAIINMSRLDFNKNGVVDLSDVSTFIYRYYLAAPGDEGWDDTSKGYAPAKYFDLNGDQIIDLVDVLIVYLYVK